MIKFLVNAENIRCSVRHSMEDNMVLPEDVRQKINQFFEGQTKSLLRETREKLTHKYKTNQAVNKSVFDTKQDSSVYAISRMPATFAVLYRLISGLITQQKIENVSSIIDIGSGTGAGFFACRELFSAKISLFERDSNMIEVFNQFETGATPKKFDLIRDSLDEKADLVMSSYVFSELSEEGRVTGLKKMLDASNRYVLIVDTGTPRTYENFMKLKNMAYDLGFQVTAPCETQKCGLKNDYCQFYARVERSSLMKLAKDAELSYEDEKYFYLLIDKQTGDLGVSGEQRIIYRPKITGNFVELKLCTKDGVLIKNVTKKDKELYKKARKININELL